MRVLLGDHEVILEPVLQGAAYEGLGSVVGNGDGGPVFLLDRLPSTRRRHGLCRFGGAPYGEFRHFVLLVPRRHPDILPMVESLETQGLDAGLRKNPRPSRTARTRSTIAQGSPTSGLSFRSGAKGSS